MGGFCSVMSISRVVGNGVFFFVVIQWIYFEGRIYNIHFFIGYRSIGWKIVIDMVGGDEQNISIFLLLGCSLGDIRFYFFCIFVYIYFF